MIPEAKIARYRPNNSLHHGYASLIAGIFRELRDNKWLTFQLFKRDLFAVYKQSFLGLLWAVINPTIQVSMFVLLSKSKVFDVGDIKVPYPIFAILGTSMWTLFSTSLTAATNSIVAAGSMISKISFSRKSLVIASVAQSGVPFLVQVCLLALLFAFFHRAPSAGVLLVPVMAIPIVLLSMGFGFMLAVANAVVRDVGTALVVVLNFVLWLTPIMYAKPPSGPIGVASRYNPIYYLVKVPRDMALQGWTSEWRGYVISIVLGIVIFWTCLVAFHLAESRLAERA